MGEDQVRISTNDALVAEVLQRLEPRNLQLVIGLREIFHNALGANFFGNAVFTQNFGDLARFGEAAASELRRRLPAACDADYIRWKFGQSPKATGKSEPGDLIFNNWCKGVDRKKLKF